MKETIGSVIGTKQDIVKMLNQLYVLASGMKEEGLLERIDEAYKDYVITEDTREEKAELNLDALLEGTDLSIEWENVKPEDLSEQMRKECGSRIVQKAKIVRRQQA